VLSARCVPAYVSACLPAKTATHSPSVVHAVGQEQSSRTHTRACGERGPVCASPLYKILVHPVLLIAIVDRSIREGLGFRLSFVRPIETDSSGTCAVQDFPSS